MQEWIVPALAGLLALVALGLAVALTRSRARTDQALARASAETAALREQLTALEQRLTRPAPPREAEASFVITDLGQQHGEQHEPEPAPTVSGTLFADLVLRETVVKAAGLAHGVRRALDPEVRHRVRYEMRREVKRSRKQRKADTREARRAWAARQRASLDEEGSAA